MLDTQFKSLPDVTERNEILHNLWSRRLLNHTVQQNCFVNAAQLFIHDVCFVGNLSRTCVDGDSTSQTWTNNEENFI